MRTCTKTDNGPSSVIFAIAPVSQHGRNQWGYFRVTMPTAMARIGLPRAIASMNPRGQPRAKPVAQVSIQSRVKPKLSQVNKPEKSKDIMQDMVAATMI